MSLASIHPDGELPNTFEQGKTRYDDDRRPHHFCMALSQLLWQLNTDLAQDCLDNPFVQGIASGSLARNAFVYYVGQDAFFLDAFARAYSITAAKAPDLKSFSALHHLAGGVLEELRLHQSYGTSWGVDLENVQPGSATRQYVDFLLSTAWSQPVGNTVVAMAPCMRLYAYLGQELAKRETSDSPYYEWITTYSSQEFQNLVDQLESLVDELTNDSDVVRSSYRYAMVCESNFFTAAYQYQP